MHPDLKDKVIIITGANPGIGKAATIVLACRSRERGLPARNTEYGK